MRIGHGYDAHRYGENLPFVLGGVLIPSDFGMIAHSDGDVLVHALMDALLGAAGLPDIGHLFPDNDEKYKGASSVELLREVASLIREKGFALEYADCTVVAQAPKLAPYIDEMKKCLEEALGVGAGRVNVKATTEEKMGFTGALEGISSHAVCILSE